MNIDTLVISPESKIESLDGFKIVYTAENRFVQPYESFHADMQLVKIGDEIITAPMFYEYYKKMLPGKKVICGKVNPDGHYPKCVTYNTAVTESFAVCNERYTDEVVLEHIKKVGLEIIDVKQGYAKCSLCIFPGGAITEDAGIYKKLKSRMDVLLIPPGGVKLTGVDYGFLGGASGFGDRIYFTGDIKTHPAYKEIKMFLDERGIEFSSIPGELSDYGTAVFV